MGFSQKQAVAISYMLAGILGLAAVLLTSSGELKALILIGAIFVVGAIGMRAIFSGREPGQKEETTNPEEASESQTLPSPISRCIPILTAIFFLRLICPVLWPGQILEC